MDAVRRCVIVSPYVVKWRRVSFASLNLFDSSDERLTPPRRPPVLNLALATRAGHLPRQRKFVGRTLSFCRASGPPALSGKGLQNILLRRGGQPPIFLRSGGRDAGVRSPPIVGGRTGGVISFAELGHPRISFEAALELGSSAGPTQRNPRRASAAWLGQDSLLRVACIAAGAAYFAPVSAPRTP